MANDYDSILIVGFGGPERPEDVMPFLENVTRGRNVPRERLLEVAEHYDHFGGREPDQRPGPRADRGLAARARPTRHRAAHLLGQPQLAPDAGRHPRGDDRRRVQAGPGRRPGGVQLLLELPPVPRGHRAGPGRGRAHSPPGSNKVRVFYNHPDFIAANADRVREALGAISADRRAAVHLAFTAHSIPVSMAGQCDYERQLAETCRLVAEAVGDRARSLAASSTRAGAAGRRPLARAGYPGSSPGPEAPQACRTS